MQGKTQRGLARIIAAAGYSRAGLRSAWRHEAAFRQEACLAVILVPAAFWVGQGAVQRVLLLGSCLLVLIVELLNSAIEAVVDRVSSERHELAARAKDMGSAAVFVSLVLVVCTWLSVAWERFGPGMPG